MANNRRSFFKNLIKKTDILQTENVLIGDPLFTKYSKKVGGRITSNKAEARKKPITTGLAEYTGPFTANEANHLLRRTQYGVKPSELAAALTKTMSKTVDDLFEFNFNVVLPSSGPLNNYSAPGTSDVTGVAHGENWTKNVFTSFQDIINSTAGDRRNSMKNWRWGVYFYEGNTIREKLTDFWLHFLPVDIDDLGQSSIGFNHPIFYYDYYQTLRNNCKGNYRTIIEKMTKSNAMIGFLGGQDSTKTVPNENFARELFELFTIGKNDIQENNNYTEADIIATSKIFSGWRQNNQYSMTYPVPISFNPDFHNQENKSFSAKFDFRVINNRTGVTGVDEFEIFFNMLFTKQHVKISEYIMERLYRFFVYYEIDDFTRANVIVPLATQFRSDNWEIMPVLKKLLKSEHFFDVINQGVMIKSPFDLIIGMVRSLEINTIKVGGSIVDHYNCLKYFNNTSSGIEQGACEFPTVSGYKAYYQKPAFYQNWINSNNLQKRETFINQMLNSTTQGNLKLQIDLVAYVKLFPIEIQQDPNLLIDACIKNLLPKDIDSTFKNDVLKKSDLLNNQTTDYYWTNAWSAHLMAPTDAGKLKTVTDRLKAMFNRLLKLAEFQLM